MPTPLNSYLIDPSRARIIRWMQDGPCVYCPDRGGRGLPDMEFRQSVADSMDNIGFITQKQMNVLERIIAEKNWVEPPRFDPFCVVEKFGGRDHYMIYICPGNRNDDELLRLVEEAKASAVEQPIRVTIGSFFDRTWDADDPRLRPMTADYKRGKRAIYVTHLHRVLNKAIAAGAVLRDPETLEPIVTPPAAA